MKTLTPNDWIRGAASLLAQKGVEGCRVEPLAKNLGVSKGSFYWHFKKRAALLDAVLHYWETTATLDIITNVEAASTNPEERLWILIERVFGTPAEYDLFESALREWARKDSRAKASVTRVDKKRLGFVKKILVEHGLPHALAKERSQLMYCTLVGEFLLRSHGQKKLAKKTLRTLHMMLLSKAA